MSGRCKCAWLAAYLPAHECRFRERLSRSANDTLKMGTPELTTLSVRKCASGPRSPDFARGTMLACSISAMQRSFWVWSISGVMAVSACGGSSFSSEGGSEAGSGGSGGTANNGSNTSSDDTSASSATGSSDGNTTSTSSAGGGPITSTASSTGGDGGTGTGGAASNDNGSTSGSGGTGGASPCTLTCERARDASGLEICECARQEHECTGDSDCGLATNLGKCCTGCKEAYPKELIDSEPCLASDGNQDPNCEQPRCAEVPCPGAACVEPTHAACEQNRCVAKYECPDGTIDDHGHCVEPCDTDEDCVIATEAGNCCGSCPAAYHRQTVEQEECLVPYGEDTPEKCMPNQDCSLVLCPELLCVEPGTAVCRDDGRCAVENGPDF